MSLYLFTRSEQELFQRETSSACVYGEYGCGHSTIFVANNTDAEIVSVDTDAGWVEAVRTSCEREGMKLIHVDLGPVGCWGRPRGYRAEERFPEYTDALWDDSPDLVLIDGRFRVACFFTSLLKAAPGTRILFHDFHRPHYHVVKEVISIEEQADSMALFVVPEQFDRERATELLGHFRRNMD